uniref:DUF423 domain-containing protein n=1 Tax=Favella ehrenbergii TaxID=182087 RepID=A0A7S3I1Q4_9SPIT|mmetsp:Transcript_28579/g.35371  ORF Transcript_28579/g.35371 Transcript_28579/m.35371 type:complete len:123 (+) Transcript_28579:7-375(+)
MKRLSWTLGTTMVGVSVAQSAIIAHHLHKMEQDEQKKVLLRRALENARMITMLNGLGLAMIALRNTKRPNLALLPMSMLVGGTGMFSGVIFYEAFTKDEQMHWIIKFGGSASIFGWIFMGML